MPVAYAFRLLIIGSISVFSYFAKGTWDDIRSVQRDVPILSQKVSDLSESVKDTKDEMRSLWQHFGASNGSSRRAK